MLRDKLVDEKDAKLKITKQMNIELKKKYANYIIDNNTNKSNTLKQLRKWILNDITIENGMNNRYEISNNNNNGNNGINSMNGNSNGNSINSNSNSNENEMFDMNSQLGGNLYSFNSSSNNNINSRSKGKEKRSISMQKWVNAMKPTKLSLIVSTGVSAALVAFYHVLVTF